MHGMLRKEEIECTNIVRLAAVAITTNFAAPFARIRVTATAPSATA